MARPKKEVVPVYSQEQINVVQQVLNRNLAPDIAIRILGNKEIFDAIIHFLYTPIPVVEKVRPWDTFYFTIIKIPTDSKVVKSRWTVYGCVLDAEGKVCKTYSTMPSSKMLAMGKFKNAMETIFAESDLKFGLGQLMALDNAPLEDDKVVMHKAVFSAPWMKVQRKPKWILSIGSFASIGSVGESIGITGFNEDKSVIIEQKTRTSIVERYATLIGNMQSIDASPMFEPILTEWTKKIAKREPHIETQLMYPKGKEKIRKKGVSPLGADGKPQTVKESKQ